MQRAIHSIQMGPRRREHLGDLEGLAASIQRYGLIHPIVVDADGTLVAGERRLRACLRLGWTEVEVRLYGELTDEEHAAIELEENLQRKNLTPIERSKTMVQLIESARMIAQSPESHRATTEAFRADSAQKSLGRPRRPGASRDVAHRTGIPRTTLRAAAQHVAMVEKYPELTEVSQIQALTIGKHLDHLHEPDREAIRDALRRHDPAVLAELAHTPTLPAESSAQAMAANELSTRWADALQNLIVVWDAMEQLGNPHELIAQWTAHAKMTAVEQMRRIKVLLTEWEPLLVKAMRESTEMAPPGGGGSSRPQALDVTIPPHAQAQGQADATAQVGATDTTQMVARAEDESVITSLPQDHRREVIERIAALRTQGLSFQVIAEQLNTEVATFSGKGRWDKGTVARLVKTPLDTSRALA